MSELTNFQLLSMNCAQNRFILYLSPIFVSWFKDNQMQSHLKGELNLEVKQQK